MIFLLSDTMLQNYATFYGMTAFLHLVVDMSLLFMNGK